MFKLHLSGKSRLFQEQRATFPANSHKSTTAHLSTHAFDVYYHTTLEQMKPLWPNNRHELDKGSLVAAKHTHMLFKYTLNRTRFSKKKLKNIYNTLALSISRHSQFSISNNKVTILTDQSNYQKYCILITKKIHDWCGCTIPLAIIPKWINLTKPVKNISPQNQMRISILNNM